MSETRYSAGEQRQSDGSRVHRNCRNRKRGTVRLLSLTPCCRVLVCYHGFHPSPNRTEKTEPSANPMGCPDLCGRPSPVELLSCTAGNTQGTAGPPSSPTVVSCGGCKFCRGVAHCAAFGLQKELGTRTMLCNKLIHGFKQGAGRHGLQQRVAVMICFRREVSFRSA
jgi:hypothetical protein